MGLFLLALLSLGVEQIRIMRGLKDPEAAMLRRLGRRLRRVGVGRKIRKERGRQVTLAAEEAGMHDGLFRPDLVKASVVLLHHRIVEAWTARNRDALQGFLSPELFTEWALRLDDLDRKGWHNITAVVSRPAVEYVGLVNRDDDSDDRVVVRIAALLPHADPPSLAVEVEVEGRRYIEDRDTIAVLSGSKHDPVRFTEQWTLALDGADDTPWRISGMGWGPAAWPAVGSEADISESLRERLRRN